MRLWLFVLTLSTVSPRAFGTGDEPYGGVFHGDCSGWADHPTLSHHQALVALASTRAERLAGFLQFALPNAWPAFRDDEKDLVRELAPRWAPPNVMDPADSLRAARSDLTRVFQAFRAKGLPCLRPWPAIPQQGEKPEMSGGFSQSNFLRLTTLLNQFRDPAWLKARSLSEVARAYNTDLAPLLTRVYSGMPNSVVKSCALNAAALAGAKMRETHCEDPRNDWLGGGATAMVNDVYPALLGISSDILASWDRAHGYPPDTAEPLWHPTGDFEKGARAGFKSAAASRLAKEKDPGIVAAQRIRADLRLRLETVVRLLNARQALPGASLPAEVEP